MTVTIFLLSLVGAMAIGMPIAFSLVFCALALMLYLGIFDTMIVAQNMIIGADSFQLLAIPFFLLAGELMNAGGLSKRIVHFAMTLVGHVHGGLGYVAIFAAIIMASLSGSAAADTAALAAILIPMMREAGYNVGRSAGLISAGGIIAPIIPPSIGFIVFGVAANLSITKLFMAGIAPGLLIGIALVIAWAIVCRHDKLKVLPKASGRERLQATWDGILALLMPIAILGGIKFGVVTPTEAAVVAVVYSLIVGMFIYRELSPKALWHATLVATKTTGAVMFLVAAAVVSAWLITQANIPAELKTLLAPFMDNRTMLMIVLMLIVMIVGTALDFTPTVLILTPVLMPIVKEAGIDPIYFGVLFIINNAIGLITPPVGIVLNVVCGVAKVPMSQVIRGVWPFLLAQTLMMLLFILVPQLIMWPLAWLTAR